MADTNQNQNLAGNDDAAKKTSLSPWDEELPEEQVKPKTVGSLDLNSSDLNKQADKKPVPFNIPADVNDEKVGKKVPAESVMPKASETKPIPQVSVSNVAQAKPAKNVQPPAGVTPSVMPKTEPAKANPLTPPAVVPPSVQKIKVADSASAPLVRPPALERAKETKPQTLGVDTAINPKRPVARPKAEASNRGKKEAGINELILPKTDSQTANDPFATAMPTQAEKSQQNNSVQNKVEMPTANQPVQPKPIIKKAPVEKPPINPAPVAKLNPESSALADIKPKIEEKESKPPILPNINKPTKAEMEKEPRPPLKPIDQTKIEKAPEAPIAKNREFLDITKPVKSNKVPFYKKAKFLIPAVTIFLFILGVYLTEAGVIGIGLEKVYGLTGVEALWGGLPRNPERALGMSVSAMQNQLNFKIKGTISMTVNKTIKSPITSPLVSALNSPYAMRDINQVSGVPATLAQYDYYGSDSSSTSTNSSTSDSTSSTSSSSTLDSTSSSTSSSSSILGDQSGQSSYQPEESTIKQVDADIEGASSDQAIETDFIIKKLVGTSPSVNLVATKGQLFVKTSTDIKYASNAEDNKWLEFNINNIQNENPFRDFASIKLDQGFSIIGRRSGNEKIGDTRCFKYTIDNLEIGDSLDFLGISKDMVQKIEGDIWIGVADHYIHKVDLKIIPSISSAISQMSVTFELYDYGVENSVNIPSLQDKIQANISVDSTTSGTSSSATTTAPSVASAVTMAERDQTRKNDLQSIKAALEKYKSTNGRFPVANTMIHLNTADNVVQKALVPEYISSLPEDPKATDGWYYGYKSNGQTFTLSARLENSADPQVTDVGNGVYLHWVYNN